MNLNTVKSNLSDLASSTLEQVTESLHHGQEALSDTSKTVGKDVSRTASRIMKSDAVETVSDKLATLTKVVAAATSAKALSKALNPNVPYNWALGALNLQRRPSTFGRILTGVGLVAAGAAVGAGIAMLLTPNNGEQNRALLRRTLEGLQTKASDVVHQVETRASEVVEQVESKTQEAAPNLDGPPRIIADARDASPASSQDGSIGGGAPGSRPRIPGMSHRSPKL